MESLSFRHADRDPGAFAAALGRSLEDTGFAVVADHGIDAELIAEADAQARALFALPEPAKLRGHLPEGAGQRGYTPFGREVAKGADAVDLKEFWHVGREPPVGAMPPNVWPELDGFQRTMTALFIAFEETGVRLLDAIARHLGIDRAFLADAVRDGNSVLRLLHYPPVRLGQSGLRAAPHEDINAITLLLGAEEAGLELRDRDGSWRAIDPPPGALVVNVGDMLQRLTGGHLRSTTHRVVNPPPARAGRPRYSMPFFLHFRPDFLIDPPPGLGDRAAHPPITADAYLRERLREIGLA